MRGALVILLAMIVIGALLFVTDVIYYRRKANIKKEEEKLKDNEAVDNSEIIAKTADHGEFCCGKHIICEKTGLTPINTEIIYYDDEELDRFKGRISDSYSQEETEEFRDILLTLLPQDVAGWARSLSLRQIELPNAVREELLMIVSEMRLASN